MANLAKFSRAAIGHMCAHYERGFGEDGERVRFGNQQIDPEKTSLNYNLAPDHEHGQIEYIRQRTSEVKCLKRDDVNVMCSWVVTYPKELTSNYLKNGIHVSITESAKQEKFFRTTYEFLEQKYGAENVVSAYVHMDEKQPHLHFAFVPVVHDKKKDIDKVSAKECVDRQELRDFHVELDRYLTEKTGFFFPVMNDATKDGNKTIAELKRQEIAAEIRKQAAASRENLAIIAEQVRISEHNKRVLENQDGELDQLVEERTASIVEPLKEKITVLEKEIEELRPFKAMYQKAESMNAEMRLLITVMASRIPEDFKVACMEVFEAIKKGLTPLKDAQEKAKAERERAERQKAVERPVTPSKPQNKGYER